MFRSPIEFHSVEDVLHYKIVVFKIVRKKRNLRDPASWLCICQKGHTNYGDRGEREEKWHVGWGKTKKKALNSVLRNLYRD